MRFGIRRGQQAKKETVSENTIKSRNPDSNREPTVYKAVALPIELFRQKS